ncbi:MAG: hypothetical protein SFU98_19345 [Leptospiraceae bacterium]|nr:hypothetical protein [Leptospiraceae bacterium]
MEKRITESKLQEGVENGYRIGLNCFTPTSSYLKNLETVLRLILKFYDKTELLPAIFGVAQEMVYFSCLSNMRYVYYSENNLSLDSEEKFLEIEPDFLKSVSGKVLDYRKKLMEKNMRVQGIIEHNDVSLILKVFNHSDEQLDHESYIRNYLKLAMNYTNVLDYFQDHPEDPGGANMGLAFSLIILKESGLRPELMRMGKTGIGNFSKIEIPFVSGYESLRDRILKDESIVPYEKPNLIPKEFQEQFAKRQKELTSALEI